MGMGRGRGGSVPNIQSWISAERMASESIPLSTKPSTYSGLPLFVHDDNDNDDDKTAVPWYRALSIIPRWVVYIVPPLVLLWIPGQFLFIYLFIFSPLNPRPHLQA